MRLLTIIIFISISLFAENIKSVTAEMIIDKYDIYKSKKERLLEDKTLKPRVINFANYLYIGVVEMKIKDKKQIILYSSILSLLAKDGKTLELPDGYDSLSNIINQEVSLIIDSNTTAVSPVMGIEIDYKEFAIPEFYKDSKGYYRAMKFAQLMEFSTEKLSILSKQLQDTIKASERLTNLYSHINKNIKHINGLDSNISNSLFAFRDIKKVDNICKLDNNYDYDTQIINSLSKAKYINESVKYSNSSRQRVLLYSKFNSIKNKKNKKNKNDKLYIQPNLIETLNIMIEGAYFWATDIKKSAIDTNIIKELKYLRYIAKKEANKIKLSKDDKKFLDSLKWK